MNFEWGLLLFVLFFCFVSVLLLCAHTRQEERLEVDRAPDLNLSLPYDRAHHRHHAPRASSSSRINSPRFIKKLLASKNFSPPERISPPKRSKTTPPYPPRVLNQPLNLRYCGTCMPPGLTRLRFWPPRILTLFAPPVRRRFLTLFTL